MKKHLCIAAGIAFLAMSLVPLPAARNALLFHTRPAEARGEDGYIAPPMLSVDTNQDSELSHASGSFYAEPGLIQVGVKDMQAPSIPGLSLGISSSAPSAAMPIPGGPILDGPQLGSPSVFDFGSQKKPEPLPKPRAPEPGPAAPMPKGPDRVTIEPAPEAAKTTSAEPARKKEIVEEQTLVISNARRHGSHGYGGPACGGSYGSGCGCCCSCSPALVCGPPICCDCCEGPWCCPQKKMSLWARIKSWFHHDTPACSPCWISGGWGPVSFGCGPCSEPFGMGY
jgi:hypothetical protein